MRAHFCAHARTYAVRRYVPSLALTLRRSRSAGGRRRRLTNNRVGGSRKCSCGLLPGTAVILLYRRASPHQLGMITVLPKKAYLM
ncbi:translation initiation factor IF-3, mitochondrial isoform X3 [Pan paniscus]|uniref:translation initiation factor IF-3, mitochondrial isoform X3 n=1 Tax=Pan paniscus TaxID=9597 RepID=UPI001560D88F